MSCSKPDPDDDVGEYVNMPIPVELIDSEHVLIHKLESVAVYMYREAAENEDASLTISRDGMMELSTSIFQLLSILRKRLKSS